ncbi:MAG: hypothetical protein GY853_01325 [PVC group bacterium]|nr:hypothetical protein [PVC group bacterium]
MNKRIVTILWPLTILLAVVLTKYYWPDVETIEIVKTETSKTEYHVGDNTYQECVESPLGVKGEIKENVLYGECYDDCKSMDFKFTLKSKSKIKHIIGLGYIFQHDIGNAYGIDYLYNFDLFQLGGGIILSKTNPGINIKIQKGF